MLECTVYPGGAPTAVFPGLLGHGGKGSYSAISQPTGSDSGQPHCQPNRTDAILSVLR